VTVTEYDTNVDKVVTNTLPGDYKVGDYIHLNLFFPKISVKVTFNKLGKYELLLFEVGKITDNREEKWVCKKTYHVPTTPEEDAQYTDIQHMKFVDSGLS